MKKFLIQTMDGKIRHDFSFQLLDAIEYNNWFYNKKVYDYILSDEVVNEKGLIPVGSLEFVFKYMKDVYQLNELKPINIPIELQRDYYLKRSIFIKDKKNINFEGDKFVKSNSKYKKITEIVNNIDLLPDDEYLVSDLIEIESEWRVFVYRNKMVGLQNYSGDFTLFPDVKLIEEMILDYNNCPPAYTLDVGVNQDGTFIIEVHPFISCGLYGFRDNKILPLMFIEAFNSQI